MKIGETWQLHDDEALRKIDEAAVRLLSGSGCRIEHEGLLAQLEGAGCRVDASAHRCFFPEKLVRDVVASFGGTLGPDVEIEGRWNPQNHLGHDGSYPHLLDWPSGRRRLATKQDVIDMARMGHSLPEFDVIGRVLTCAEVEPRIEPLWTTLALARTTDKPIGAGELFYADHIEPLVRMGEILTGKKDDTSLVSTCDFFIAPLTMDRKQAECFVEKRCRGIVNVPGTMPISGISAPVTIAGTVTIAIAELMAGWVLGHVVNPDIPASGIVSSGSLDMRTVSACFGSPEALLQDMTTVQICRRLYAIPVHAAINYVDCKRPGLEAVFQKMYPLVSSAFGTGVQMGASGLLSAGQDYSPVQHLLDLEIHNALERFHGSFEISEESIALDLIENMLQKDATNFLDTDHTARHFKSEQWYPKWFDRRLWQGQSFELEAERKMLERIDRYWKDAVARYERPDADLSKIEELQSLFATAERNIPGRR
jgi:trimethylamine--corrinoid protein Co-methyltransferase